MPYDAPLSGWIRRLFGWCEQRSAELSRLPTLLTRVIPELYVARQGTGGSFLDVLAGAAAARPHAVALWMGERRITYAQLVLEVDAQAARFLRAGLRPGQRAALCGSNSLEYVVALLAAARLGVPVALPDFELSSELLGEALDRAGVEFVLYDAASQGRVQVATCLPGCTTGLFETASENVSELDPSDRVLLGQVERAGPRPGWNSDFAYVFTSGTTGRSKPCRVTHGRALLASSVFGRLVMRLRPDDVLYCPLPLCHSSALLLGLCACLRAGATLVLRERFSARQFLPDIRRTRATVLLYVGELGRALLQLPESPADREHGLRLAVGNGMHETIWEGLQRRFGIPEVCEFYSASEFPGAIVNLTGRRGSLGHIPLSRVRGYRLVRVDLDSGALVRDARGFAIECTADEPGELLLRLHARPDSQTGDYTGYLGESARSDRIARDVFQLGDLYCRSGDLMRRDRLGYYYFVDRLGDTFRCKGHNVSTREVEDVLARTRGVQMLSCSGLRLPHHDGKFGLLTLAVARDFQMADLERQLTRLPPYAQPGFLRIVPEVALTSSLKAKRAPVVLEDLTPGSGAQAFWRRGEHFVPLTRADYERITAGQERF